MSEILLSVVYITKQRILTSRDEMTDEKGEKN